MEENSETQMETDVASCTDESTGSHGDMETVIVVEEIKEEDDPPESSDKVKPVTEIEARKESISSEILFQDLEKTPYVPEVTPQKIPQSTSKIKSPKELKMTLSRDILALRTYSRSPVSQSGSKDSQISKVDQFPNKHSIQVPTDSPSKLLVKQDACIKDHHKILQKSPTKPEQSKDVQPVTDVVNTPSKATAKKVVTSPSKDKDLQKSPTIPELCKSILPSDTSDTPKMDNPSQSMLLNPLLLSALSRQTAIKFTPEITKSKPEETSIVISGSTVDISEKSSDFAPEVSVETVETHNKSISRELRSLINSAKESKIISECTQLTTKTRKSRGNLDISSSSTGHSESDRPEGSSDTSITTNSTERLDKSNLKRSMRSQNPDFVNKVKLFLNSVTGKVAKTESESISEEETEEKKVKDSLNNSLSRPPKKKKSNETAATTSVKGSKIRSDRYCWRCHWSVEQDANEKQHVPMRCTVCPRSIHYKCLSGIEKSKITRDKNWVCPECLIVLHAESSATRSPAMKKISVGTLCDLLKFAMDRMMDLNGVEPFMQSVDRTSFPDYEKYIVHPMDLQIMKRNIDEGLYGSTEAFMADAQWILHNSIIFNTVQSKLTAAARALVRSCKAEMGEIEACPECYSAAHSRRLTWFTDVCSTPHMLLWAKLKGFPYWPAKCMSVSSTSLVDVRFFGAHDRAWVPVRDCFLFSEKDPNNFRNKRHDILESMQEAEQHIRNISRRFGKFVYPPFKTQLDITKLTVQLKSMIPAFEGQIIVPKKEKPTPRLSKNKSRSNCSKSSSNDGEVSDVEESHPPPANVLELSKMLAQPCPVSTETTTSEDFAVVNKVSKATSKVANVPKEFEISRKRRRSQLQEAVITIMEGPKEKKKCLESDQAVQRTQTETKIINVTPQKETPKQKVVDMEKVTEVKIVSSTIPLDDNNVLNDSTTEVKRPPIKMILKTNKCFKPISPKEKDSPNKTTPLKLRVLRIDKTKLIVKEKHGKTKSHKRRDSKHKSLSTSIAEIITPEKHDENKTSDVVDNSTQNKSEIKDNTVNLDKTGDENTIESNGGDQKENSCKVAEEKVKQPKSTEQEATKENNSAKSKEPPTAEGEEIMQPKSVEQEATNENNSAKSKEPPKPEGEKVKQPKSKEQEVTKENNSAKSKEPPQAKGEEGNQPKSKEQEATKENNSAKSKEPPQAKGEEGKQPKSKEQEANNENNSAKSKEPPKDEGEKVKQPKLKDQDAAKENNSAKSKEPPKSKQIIGVRVVAGDKLKDTNSKINRDSPKTRSSSTPKYKETVGNIHSEKNASFKRCSTASPKTTKERVQVDEENTSLAVIARESLNKGSLTGLPTISSVRSLSSPLTVDGGTKTSNKLVENIRDSSVFTPTSAAIVRNMNDTVTKWNKIRSDTNQSLVGKVGVCAFARMPSTPPADHKGQGQKGSNKAHNNVEVEIKTEPMDLDDADRQVEKLHLMKTFSLRPVMATQLPQHVRDVKINKITSAPSGRKIITKPDPKNKAKKVLPQPKKGEDGRSELNSKNSMVYIPIQPPVTQAPIRMTKPVTVNGNASTVPTSRANVTIVTANNPGVNAPTSTQVVIPSSQVVLPSTKSSPSVPTTMTIVSVTSSANQMPLQTFPTGTIPTSLHSVHTVPLITSVNGQWTFSLQPIMSVGGLDVMDEDPPATLVNGVKATERTKAPLATVTSMNGPTPAPFVAVPKPTAGPNILVVPNTASNKVAVPTVQPSVQSASPLTLANRSASEDTPASTAGEPPRLQHKPLLHPFDVNTPLGDVPPPSTAGPITAKLNQNAIKITDFFRTIIEDTIEKIDDPTAELTASKLQLEEVRWRHQQELSELRHNHDLVIAEMRATFDKDRARAVNEARRTAQLDLEAAVKVAKSKQWCAHCSQEAQFYCCWNTSYCDYGCQRAHWTQHYATCMQSRSQDSDSESNSVSNKQRSSTDNVPQPLVTPTLSKAPTQRVFNKEQQPSPKSIIVSMVDDRTGNPTVKCVGTYKPSPQPATSQMPIIINKPVTLMNNDDLAAKKVVTSGGYLIVGAPNTSPLVTPPRRPQTIQYFS